MFGSDFNTSFGSENCPRCLNPLSEERARSTPKVCDTCGHVLTANVTQHKKQYERSSLRWTIGAGVFVTLALMQMIAWGGYSLEVLPLKAAILTGVDSAATDERMAQICLELKKLDCVESMYIRQAVTDVKNFVRLGKFQYNRMKYAEAAQSLQNYFARGGDASDLDSRYVFARALGQSGQVELAAQQFDLILAAKPMVLQITVTENYIKLLVQYNRLEQALKVLDGIRARDESVGMFMDSEYKNIAEKLGKHT
jgi:hypothetical protein